MTRFVVLAAMVAAIGGSLFGYDTGVISGAILFIRPEFGLGTTQEELVISAALVGATIGAIASGRLTDRLGRRAVFRVSERRVPVGKLLLEFLPGRRRGLCEPGREAGFVLCVLFGGHGSDRGAIL